MFTGAWNFHRSSNSTEIQQLRVTTVTVPLDFVKRDPVLLEAKPTLCADEYKNTFIQIKLTKYIGFSSSSSSTVCRSKWNLEVLVFAQGGKLAEKSAVKTSNSTHM